LSTVETACPSVPHVCGRQSRTLAARRRAVLPPEHNWCAQRGGPCLANSHQMPTAAIVTRGTCTKVDHDSSTLEDGALTIARARPGAERYTSSTHGQVGWLATSWTTRNPQLATAGPKPRLTVPVETTEKTTARHTQPSEVLPPSPGPPRATGSPHASAAFVRTRQRPATPTPRPPRPLAQPRAVASAASSKGGRSGVEANR